MHMFFWRFLVEAPLTASIVLLRSPRGLRKDRWVAWRLARAHRLRRRLNQEKLARLEELIHKGLLEYVKIPVVTTEGWIIWRTINTPKLVPINKIHAA